MRWIPFAMVRVAAFFVAGILLYLASPDLLSVTGLTVFLITILLAYFLAWTLFKKSNALRLTSGVIGLLAVFLSGYLNGAIRNQAKWEDHILHAREEIQSYTVKLVSSPEEKEKSWKQRGEIQALLTKTGWRHATGLVNLYWPKNELAAVRTPGEILLVKGHPQEVEPPRNPFQFDLKKFLASKNIFHQHFLRKPDWKAFDPSDESGVLFFSHKARAWSIAAIKEFIHTPQEQGIVIALVLGVTDGIDDDLQSAYAASGAMHVLAVSGLHVSIIYGILLFFLKPFDRTATGQWMVALICLVFLWAYAFLTGLSPSVLRAVTMFSFVVLAKPIGKNTNIYNTLAASAFFLLLYDPLLILSVGFQLSYLAVLGIVYMQRPLYNLWAARSAIIDWAWQISCVSIAAQVATIALGLYYFHQFPVYFLLANLFVIPGSFVVLIAGIVLILVSPFTLPASWLGYLLAGFVKVLNQGVFWVERLPGSLIDGIYISSLQCGLLLMMILFILLLFHFRKFQYLLASTLCAFIFSVLSWDHFITSVQPARFIVYHVPNRAAMELSERGYSVFAADSAITSAGSAIGFNIEPYRLAHGISKESVLMKLSFMELHGMKFWRWKGKTFLWIGSTIPATIPAFKGRESGGVGPVPRITADFVIVSDNAVRSVAALSSFVTFNHLIFDSSNARWYHEKLSKETIGLAGRRHWVLKDGAFTVTL